MAHNDRYQLERFAKTEEEFQTFYNEHLQDQMKEFKSEGERLVPLRRRAIRGRIIAVLLFFGSTLLAAVFPYMEYFQVLFIGAGLGILLYTTLTYHKEKKIVESALKQKIVRKLVHFLNPYYTYEPENYISKQEFLNAELFSRDADEYRGDDLIKGYVEDQASGFRTDLSFSEAKATEIRRTTDSKGNTKTIRTTFFHGLLFVVDFHKDFGDTITQVVPNRKTLFGKTKKAGGVSTQFKLDRIDIEHPAFNEHFLVRSNDEVMSRVILQLDFIEKLLQYTKQTGMVAKNKPLEDHLYITFKDGKMYLLINTKRNHFAIDGKEINTQLVEEFYRDINQSLELIDALNLNLRIYDKK